MTLLWADPFDQFGGSEAMMLDGLYAQVDECELSTAHPATGSYGMHINGSTGLTSFSGLRKILPASRDKLGMAARFYFPELPTNAYEAGIFMLMPVTTTGRCHINVVVGNNGELHFIRGGETFQNVSHATGGTIVASTDPLIVASAMNHIEVQIYLHDTLGWIRVAINGIHRYEATGLDTKYNAENCSAISQGRPYLTGDTSSRFYFDDYYIYDFNGDSAVYTDWCPTTDGAGKATNYMGEWDCRALYGNADTAETDWVRLSGANDYDMINNVPANDAQYIYSAAADDLSEFDFEDLPEDVTVIRGLMHLHRLSKSDSGAALFKAGVNSSGVTEDGAEKPITVEPTYWWDFFNVDPNTDARWTRAGLNAAKFRLLRSA